MIFQSTGLTAAHLTRTRTSPGATLGTGSRVSESTSVPPYLSYAIARMVFWDIYPTSPCTLSQWAMGHGPWAMSRWLWALTWWNCPFPSHHERPCPPREARPGPPLRPRPPSRAGCAP